MIRNPIVQILLAVTLFFAVVVALAIVVMLSGCSVSATEQAISNLNTNTPETRLDAIVALSDAGEPRGIIRLVETFVDYPDTREEAAKALVYAGREIANAHPEGPIDTGASANIVVTEVWKVAVNSNVDHSIRAKSVWVLAEMCDRRVMEWIEPYEGPNGVTRLGAHAADSMDVQEEIRISRAKLGIADGEVHEFELLGDWTTVADYDPQKRGHIEEVE